MWRDVYAYTGSFESWPVAILALKEVGPELSVRTCVKIHD